MDRNTNQILFALLRSAICGDPLQEHEKRLCSEELLSKLIAISKKHDISHLLALGLDINSIHSQESQVIEKQIAKAVYRYEQINREFVRLCKELEAAQIDFIPLKGSVIREYYPEAWMRTSCDIDVLLHESDAEEVAELFTNRYGYTRPRKNSHEVSSFSPNGVHIELHYNLIEDRHANASSTVLGSVWDTVVARDGFTYWHEMPDEMFYFYHVAHMAKHFEEGGCGIRPFIDLWILDNIEGADQSKRDELLKQGDLLKFAEVARLLSKVWFNKEEHTEITRQMEHYILRGGVYGTSENRITIQQQKKGGRLKYALSKTFIPYDVIKFHYPILQKHRWLTPFMEIRRWFKLVFCGHAKRTMRELKYNNNIAKDAAANAQQFLKNIGL
jgi:hypothetical protein